jgi:hypothetical protein
MLINVLIFDPDQNEAEQQAATLTDYGFAVETQIEGDPIESARAKSPHVLILRHERSEQSGLALISRIREQGLLPDVALLLTTSELSLDDIEQQKENPHTADLCLRLPADETLLVSAVLDLTSDENAPQPTAAVANPNADPGAPAPAPAPSAQDAPAAETPADSAGSQEAVPAMATGEKDLVVANGFLPEPAPTPSDLAKEMPQSSGGQGAPSLGEAENPDGIAEPTEDTPQDTGIVWKNPSELPSESNAQGGSIGLENGGSPPQGAGQSQAPGQTQPEQMPSSGDVTLAPNQINSVNRSISSAELKRIQAILISVTHVKLEEEPAPDMAHSRFDGPERKVMLLRHHLKERERQLAFFGYLWEKRRAEMAQLKGTIAKDASERNALLDEMNALKKQHEQQVLQWEKKRGELGKTLGEQFDALHLREAELIQEVALRENQLNKEQRRQREQEKQNSTSQEALTKRIYEWEAAYQGFQEHHGVILEAWHQEFVRLERLLNDSREQRDKTRDKLFMREEQLARQQQVQAEQRVSFLGTVHAAREHSERGLTDQQRKWAYEKSMRIGLELEQAELQGKVFDLEINLERATRMLEQLNAARRRELGHLAGTLEDKNRDFNRLLMERQELIKANHHLQHTSKWSATWSEAAISHLIETGDVERTHVKREIWRRDQLQRDLEEKVLILERQETNLQERLASETEGRTEENQQVRALETELRKTVSELQHIQSESQNERARFAEQNSRLQEQLNGRTAELDAQTKTSLDKERKDTDEKTALRNRVTEQQAALKALDGQAIEQQRSLESYESQIATLNASLERRDKRIADNSQEIQAMDARIVAAESEAARISLLAAEQEAEIRVRGERMEQMRETDARQSDEIRSQKNQIEELSQSLREKEQVGLQVESQLESLSIAAEQASEEKTLAQAEMQRLENAIRAKEETLASKVSALEIAESDSVASTAISAEIQNQLNIVEKRNEELRNLLDETNEAHRETAASNESLIFEKDQLIRKTASLQSENEKMRGENSNLQENLSEIKGDTQALLEREKRLVKTAAESEQQLNQLEGDKTNSANEHHRLTEEITHQGKELVSLRAERDESVLQLSQFQNRFSDIEEERLRFEAQNKKLIEENEGLRSEYSETGTLMEQMKQEMLQVRGKMSSMSSELENQKTQNDDAGAAMNELRMQYEKAQEAASQNMDELQNVSTKAKTFEEELTASEAAFHELNTRFQTLTDKFSASEQSQNAIGQQHKQAKNEVQSLQAALDGHRASYNALEAENKTSKETLAEMQATFSQNQQTMVNLQKQFQEAEEKVLSLNKRVSSLTKEKESAYARVAELSQKRRETEGPPGGADASLMPKVTQENEALKTLVAELKEQVSQKQIEKENLKRVAEKKLRAYAAKLAEASNPTNASTIDAGAPIGAPTGYDPDSQQTKEVQTLTAQVKQAVDSRDPFQNQATQAFLKKDT